MRRSCNGSSVAAAGYQTIANTRRIARRASYRDVFLWDLRMVRCCLRGFGFDRCSSAVTSRKPRRTSITNASTSTAMMCPSRSRVTTSNIGDLSVVDGVSKTPCPMARCFDEEWEGTTLLLMCGPPIERGWREDTEGVQPAPAPTRNRRTGGRRWRGAPASHGHSWTPASRVPHLRPG